MAVRDSVCHIRVLQSMPLIEWLLKLRHHYSPQLDVRLYPFPFGAEAVCDGPLPLHTCGAGALPHVQSFTSRISISVCKDAVLLSLRCGRQLPC